MTGSQLIPAPFWCRLPFAPSEIHGCQLDVHCTDTARLLRGHLLVQENPAEPQIFAVIGVLSESGVHPSSHHKPRFALVDPVHVAALGRCQLNDGRFYYYLAMPQFSLHPLPAPGPAAARHPTRLSPPDEFEIN